MEEEASQDTKGADNPPQNDQENKNVDDPETASSTLPHTSPPPDPLPPGWVVRHSRSHPGYVYYFHQDTGECRWEIPQLLPSSGNLEQDLAAAVAAAVSATREKDPDRPRLNLDMTTDDNNHNNSSTSRRSSETKSRSSRKRARDEPVSNAAAAAAGTSPKEVRVLHILKKHSGSRRPSSWRNPKITISKTKAMEELKELITILEEVSEDPKELRATFEELARTESDCSSAKRGGDLGYFGRRKMQPAFEKASFGLKVGELSGIVETSSGVHVILRLG